MDTYKNNFMLSHQSKDEAVEFFDETTTESSSRLSPRFQSTCITRFFVVDEFSSGIDVPVFEREARVKYFVIFESYHYE